MSNKVRSVLYIGVTNDLYRRYNEHRTGSVKGFTQKYRCCDLLYFEEYNNVDEAIAREKELKGWKRYKKEYLIASNNPEFVNMAEEFGW